MTTFEIDHNQHVKGDESCSGCWDTPEHHGKDEECGGKGLVHTEFGDEDMDCNYWLYERCDICEVD